MAALLARGPRLAAPLAARTARTARTSASGSGASGAKPLRASRQTGSKPAAVFSKLTRMDSGHAMPKAMKPAALRGAGMPHRAAAAPVKQATVSGARHMSTKAEPVTAKPPAKSAAKPAASASGPSGSGAKPAPKNARDVATPSHSAAAAVQNQRVAITDEFSLWAISQDRRMTGPPFSHQSTRDTDARAPDGIQRRDNWPHLAATPPEASYPGQAKSHVDATGTVRPALDAELSFDAILRHVEGKPADKAVSPLTSWLPGETAAAVDKMMQNWGGHKIEADVRSFGAFLNSAEVVREMRDAVVISGYSEKDGVDMHNEWLQTAKTNLGAKWLPDNDSMFTPVDHEDALAIVELMVQQGIDPLKAEFTRRDRVILWNARQQELLTIGPSTPGAATVTALPSAAAVVAAAAADPAKPET